MTLHILPDLQQGSEEWFAQRRGMVTASVVDRLLTVGSPGAIDYDCPECEAPANSPCISRSRKEPTPIKTPHSIRAAVAADHAKDAPPVIETADNDTSRALTATLVAERISGFTEDTPMSSDMWRGVEMEPIARDIYFERIAPVTEVGFMVEDKWGYQIGYSPDGLVGDDGLIEIKAPRAKTHLTTVLADKVPAYNMAQLQTGLLVTSRKWVDFIPFVGGFPMWTKRVYPDPVWQTAIVAAVEQFEKTAAEMETAYRAATAGIPLTEHVNPYKVDLKLS